jgi:ketosteroid isomerase-like protein
MRIASLWPAVSTAVLGAIPANVLADASPMTPEQIVAHHNAATESGDLDGLVSDYARDAVVISPAGPIEGIDAIRKTYADLLSARVVGTTFELQQKIFTKDVAYVTWVQNAGKPDEARGADTFVIREGKIALQTVAVVPLHSPSITK